MLKVEIVYWIGNIKTKSNCEEMAVVDCNRRERVKCVYPQTFLLVEIKINIFYNIIVAEDVLNIIRPFGYVGWDLWVVVRNRKNINVALCHYVQHIILLYNRPW